MSGLLKYEHNDYYKVLDNKEFIALTRYQYPVGLVTYALMYALLDDKQDNALFWAYELYHSGYQLMLVDLLLTVYYTNYAIFNPEIELILLEQLIIILNNVHFIKHVSYHLDINQYDNINVCVGNIILLFYGKVHNMDVLGLMQQINILSNKTTMNGYLQNNVKSFEQMDVDGMMFEDEIDNLIQCVSNINIKDDKEMQQKEKYTKQIIKICKELIELEEECTENITMTFDEIVDCYIKLFIQYVISYYLQNMPIINADVLDLQLNIMSNEFKKSCMILKDIVCHPTYGSYKLCDILFLKVVSSMLHLFNILEGNIHPRIFSKISMMYTGENNPFKKYDMNLNEYKNHIDQTINIYENDCMKYHNYTVETIKELVEHWLFYMAISPVWTSTLQNCYGAIICYNERKVTFSTKKKEQEFNELFGYYKITNRVLSNYNYNIDLMEIYKKYNTNSLLIMDKDIVSECSAKIAVHHS